MQASPIDKNPNDLTSVKYIQVTFVTNIQAMLEIFISLYELRRSTLQDVFLCPSSQFEGHNENDEFLQKRYVSVYTSNAADPNFPTFLIFPIEFSAIDCR